MAKQKPLQERIRERVADAVKWLRQPIRAATKKRRHEAHDYSSDGGEDEPQTGTIVRQGYRSATSGQLRDFTQFSYDDILSVVWSLYQSNPVAARMLKIKLGYILGSGVTRQIPNGELRKIIDNFDEINKLTQRLPQFIHQLRLWGEQIFPVFVKESNGEVRISYVDPSEVKEIVTHPENGMEKWAVVLKEVTAPANKPWIKPRKMRVLRCIRKDESVVKYEERIPAYTDINTGEVHDAFGELVVVNSKHTGLYVTAEQATLEDWEPDMIRSFTGKDTYDGSCLLYQVNNVSNQPRGFSDLLQVADWLDMLDRVMTSIYGREEAASYFAWDVTLTGMSEDDVLDKAAQIAMTVPARGMANVHNENATWELKTPDLKQNPSIDTATAFLTHVLGGVGFPKHWYGYGDETNRATAQAQGDPTWRTLEQEQAQARDMLLEIFMFVRDQAVIAKHWKPESEDDNEIGVQMPEMTMKDLGMVTTALGQTSDAVKSAEDNKLMTHAHGVQMWAKVAKELDVEIDPDQEMKDIAMEQVVKPKEEKPAEDLGDLGGDFAGGGAPATPAPETPSPTETPAPPAGGAAPAAPGI